jgi:hypothetical protein
VAIPFDVIARVTGREIVRNLLLVVSTQMMGNRGRSEVSISYVEVSVTCWLVAGGSIKIREQSQK